MMRLFLIGWLCLCVVATLHAQAVPPTPIPAPSVTRPPAVRSVRTLEIPRLNLRSPIKTFAYSPRLGTWRIAPNERQVGHFYGTAWLDTVGNVVLGAHSRYPNHRPALFFDLHTLQAGDLLLLSEGSTRYTYVVTAVFVVDQSDVSVLARTDDYRLTLITCDVQSYQADSGTYLGRVVVVAERVAVDEVK